MTILCEKKIVLIGAGAVGTSFIYSAINQGLAQKYGIIDINIEVARGHALDLEDAIAVSPFPATEVVAGDYKLVKDADILVITAGRPQRDGETRLQMVEDNAKIMASIADQVKKQKFSGITIIASNPVDVMTAVYQKRTGFNPKKVLSSSCTLDTSRLKLELSKAFGVSTHSIGAFVLGEHGDSSVSTLTHATISGVPITEKDYLSVGLTPAKRKALHERVYKKAYEIISRKRATHYGIGTTLADIARSVLRNENRLMATGTLLTGQYGHKDVYAGVPCIVGKEGCVRTFEFPLSKEEKKQFDDSVKVLKEVTKKAIAVTSKKC